jgi:hypothetical protein
MAEKPRTRAARRRTKPSYQKKTTTTVVSKDVRPQYQNNAKVSKKSNKVYLNQNRRFNNKNKKKNKVSNTFKRITLDDLMSPTLKSYTEAVSHPFGSRALGALLPDSFQERVIPAHDRLTFDITPSNLNFIGDWQAPPSGSSAHLLGVITWLQPRCLAQHSLLLVTAGGELEYPYYISPGYGRDTNDSLYATKLYNLCYTGVWSLTDTGGTTFQTTGLYVEDTGEPTAIPAYYIKPFPRLSTIQSTCSKARILGMGLKLWATEAPINTGGYVTGGWAQWEDFKTVVRSGQSDYLRYNASNNLVTSMVGYTQSNGRQGITVRYSPLQDGKQLRHVAISLVADDFVSAVNANGDYLLTVRDNLSLAAHDSMQEDTYVPITYWQFNQQPDGTTDVYTLKVMSIVHTECVPTGQNPFMSYFNGVDPMTHRVMAILENWQVFPPSEKGHSFKSFLEKTSKVWAGIMEGASKTYQILQLFDKVAGTLGTAALML